MSWVFLTDIQAWKLKKPVRTEYLDFSTVEARRRNANTEIRLNRRLAHDVYLGVVRLCLEGKDTLRLGSNGVPVDWLVLMRRLPADRMLDYVIAHKTVSQPDLLKLASLLADFYTKRPPALTTNWHYRARLARDLEKAEAQLISAGAGITASLVHTAIQSALDFLRSNPEHFDRRVRAGKIIEAHGDLRPEHICLETRPVIIDCLEFNPTLRTLDAASELAFLALECERLGAPEIGQVILKHYREITDDHPSNELLGFYRTYHACIRAKIALSHLCDGDIERRPMWIAKARQYLAMAARMDMAA
jgi:aminoglycoside phosphotransferase family enzyme